MDERSGVVRTRGKEPFQLDMEYVLYVKAEDHNGRIGNRSGHEVYVSLQRFFCFCFCFGLRCWVDSFLAPRVLFERR